MQDVPTLWVRLGGLEGPSELNPKMSSRLKQIHKETQLTFGFCHREPATLFDALVYEKSNKINSRNGKKP